jgi:hypothetical protein
LALTLLALTVGRGAAWRPVAVGLVTGLLLATEADAWGYLLLPAGFGLLGLGGVPATGTLLGRLTRRLGSGLLGLATAVLSHRLLWPDGAAALFLGLAHGLETLQPPTLDAVGLLAARLLLEEPAAWLAPPALVWVLRRRHDPRDLLLAAWTLAVALGLAMAQVQAPGLLVQLVLPMALLAGRWLGQIWECHGAGRGFRLVLVLLLAWGLRENLWLNFRMPPATAHLLVYAGAAPELRDLARDWLSRPAPAGQVFVAGPAAWPLAWYLRERELTFGLYPGWERTALLLVGGPREHPIIAGAGFPGRAHLLATRWQPDLGHLLGPDLPAWLWAHRTRQTPARELFWVFTRPAP